jgi:hypothetical protein
MYIILSFRAGTFRSTDKFRVIYKNGIAQWSDYAATTLSFTGILTIGAYLDNSNMNLINCPLKGSVDQFRFWKRSLSGTELSNTYSNAPVPTTNLYFAYEFDTAGTTVYDYSGGARHLTVGAGAIYEQDGSLCVKQTNKNEKKKKEINKNSNPSIFCFVFQCYISININNDMNSIH